jgi:hypothetical protein
MYFMQDECESTTAKAKQIVIKLPEAGLPAEVAVRYRGITPITIEDFLFGNMLECDFDEKLCIIIELSWAERCVTVSIEDQQKMSCC